jgi:serine O-acetyltransferase
MEEFTPRAPNSQVESSLPLESLTWKQTFARLRADRERLSEFLSSLGCEKPRRVLLHPSFLCVFFYRVSNHFYRRGHRLTARFFWHLNVIVTGADISAPNDLEGGLLIVSPPGTAIMGRAGRNLTVMPCAGLGSELGRWEDIGAGPGLPVLGDDVTLAPHSGALGPIRIGNRVRIGPGIAVTVDVSDDTLVEGPRPRILKRRNL